MTPETYSFSGDATTFLGLIGIASTLLIVVVAFRRFFNSPYNVRYVVPPNDLYETESNESNPPTNDSN